MVVKKVAKVNWVTRTRKKVVPKKKKFSLKGIFWFKGFTGNLIWKVDIADKPLNWLSIIFLIAFDIFIFINLVSGLDNQRDNIESPHNRYEYTCSNLFDIKEKDFQYSDLLVIEQYKNNGFSKWNKHAPFYKEGLSNQKPGTFCGDLEESIFSLQESQEFIWTMHHIKSLKQVKQDYEIQKRNYENEYKEFRQDYTAWLEGHNNRISDIDAQNIRKGYEIIVWNIISHETKVKEQIHFLNRSSWVTELKKYIEGNKHQFQEEKSSYLFLYPVYVTLMEMILILPLFFVSVFLYGFALKKKKIILSILFSNLSLITWIFTFYILIKVIYWLIPKKFLANLFEYLASMKLLAIWNYLLVVFGILLFGFLIFFSQRALEKWKKIKDEQSKEKEVLNKERIQKERFWAKVCIDCNTKLLPDAHFCSNCWVDQYRACKSCKHSVPKAYKFCDKCGK